MPHSTVGSGDTPEDELFEILKSAGTKIDNNEDSSVSASSDLHEEPGNRESRNIDAPWGEEGPKDPAHNSNAVWNQSRRNSVGVLSKAFSGFRSAASANKSVISQSLSTRSYESRSPMLKQAHTRASTLLERVKRITGRF